MTACHRDYCAVMRSPDERIDDAPEIPRGQHIGE
jgi:hypothetical protein